MVTKLKIGLLTTIGILIISIVSNLWFYFGINLLQAQVSTLTSQNNILESQLTSLQAQYEALETNYTLLSNELENYQQTHLFSNTEYEDTQQDSYARGYDDAEFSFYYTKPKTQSYGVENLETIVNQVEWSRPYEEDVFDCSEMSAYMERYLENHGFNAIILVGDPFGLGSHAWVLAETGESEYMPVEATAPRVVLWGEENFEHYFEYNREYQTIYDAIDDNSAQYDWWVVFP